MARRVAISIGPLASTRTKNEESLARASPRSDYFGFCSDARRRYAVQKNDTDPFLSRASDRGISFFIFHRRRRRRTICFAAWRAPTKTGGCRSSWLTAARRKDDDGDDRVVTMPFRRRRCFTHAKTRLPRIQFFTGAFRTSLVTMQLSNKSRGAETIS